MALIVLFWLKISGCHGHNWLYGYQGLGPILGSSADRRGAWIIRNQRPTFPNRRPTFSSSPPHPISRYFCKNSLMTPPPPNTPPHFKPLYCYCYPSKNFHRAISFIFHSCSFVFHSCSLVFIRVHLCSLVFHSCFTRVHSCSIRVSLGFTRVHSCLFVFIRVHSCSFVFIRVRSCSFVCRSVWCFRYDHISSSIWLWSIVSGQMMLVSLQDQVITFVYHKAFSYCIPSTYLLQITKLNLL